MPDFRTRFARDPKVCGGLPVFRGTRVPLRIVLASLADGDSSAEILASYPSLLADDIEAAIAFAAAASLDDMPLSPLPDDWFSK